MQFDGMSTDELVRTFIDSYEDLAGSEILSRAFVAERNKERSLAAFWSEVFIKLVEFEASRPQPNFVTPKAISTVTE